MPDPVVTAAPEIDPYDQALNELIAELKNDPRSKLPRKATPEFSPLRGRVNADGGAPDYVPPLRLPADPGSIRSNTTPVYETAREMLNPMIGDAASHTTADVLDRIERTGTGVAKAATNFGYGMTGIPMAIDAGQNYAEAEAQGDWPRRGLAVGEGALAALPLLKPATSFAGGMTRATAAYGLPQLAGMSIAPTPAEAADKKSPMPAAGESDPAVVELQTEAKRKGYYSGPLDGVMGKDTREAVRRMREDQRASGQDETARKAIEAQLAETERQRVAAEQAEKTRKEGDQRMQDAEKNLGFFNRMMRDYGPFAGYVLGAAAGYGTRYKVLSKSEDLATRRAQRANDIFSTPPRDWPDRVGRVNQFYGDGANRSVIDKVLRRNKTPDPFIAAPGNTPPYRSNPNTPAASSLYQPNAVNNMIVDAGATGGFVGESYYAQEHMVPKAEKELEDARVAAKLDPSEANIARLQSAMNGKALADMLTNFGRVGAMSYVGSSLYNQRTPVRPNTREANAERIRIEQQINRSTPSGPGGLPGGGNGGAAIPLREAEPPSLPGPSQPRLPPPEGPTSPTKGGPPEAPTEPPKAPRQRRTSGSGSSRSTPSDLPEGHSYDRSGKGSKIRGPNGRWSTKPDEGVQVNDMIPYGRPRED